MARLLAYTSPARGHLFPLTPILAELRDRGHEIHLRTLASEVETMRGLGFDAAPIDPKIEQIGLDDYEARTPLAAQKLAMGAFGRRAEHDARDLATAIQEVSPDTVLVDVMTWGAGASAEAWGGPWASWCPFPLPLPSPDAPPYGPGLRPAGGRLGRLRDAALRPPLRRVMARAVLPGLNSARRQVGLAALSDPSQVYAAMPLLFYMTAEPFEYPRSDWPANIRFVGPCDWDPPSATPDWLGQLDRRHLVLVTTSSEFQDDGRLVQCALEALA